MRCRNYFMAVLVGFSMIGSVYAAGEPNVFFGPAPKGQPTLEDHLLDYINGATNTLDCCFFDVKSWPLTEAFAAAAKRGVKVRFVTDDERYWSNAELKAAKIANRAFRKAGSDETYNKIELREQIQTLVDAGIVVKNDDNSPLMHNKFCVKDGQFVWTGSYNITIPGCTYNLNNSIWVENKELADIFTREFEEMFTDEIFGEGPTLTRPDQSTISAQVDKTDQTVDSGTYKYEVLFAPEDRPNDRILEIVRNATDEVYFMHYAFTHDGIGNMCVEKHLSGIKVEGIMDHLLYRSTGPSAEFNKLTQAGINVSVVRPHKGIQHNKLFIIDPHTDHGVVVTGSLNISDSGGDSNDENTLVVHDSATALKYFNRYKEVQQDFSEDIVSEVLTLKPIVAGQIVEEMTVHIVTNGKPVETVSIELPARWKVKDEVVANAKIYRGNADISESAIKLYKSNRIVFSSVNLEATGDLRSLRIVFNDVPAPKKPGLYTFYVKAGVGNDHNTLEPIAELPTVEAFDPKDLDEIMDSVNELYTMLDNLLVIDVEADTEEEQRAFFIKYNSHFAGIENVVLSEVASGQYDTIMKVCNYIQKARNKTSLIYKAILSKLIFFRKIVLSQAIHSDNTELRELAATISKLCEENSSGATAPLAPE